MKNILLTGHDFPREIQRDGTKECVEKFNSAEFREKRVIGSIIPNTPIAAYNKLNQLINENKIDAIISMGNVSSANAIRLQRNIYNRRNSQDDTPVWNSPEAAPVFSSDLDLDHYVKLMKEYHIPAETTCDIGLSFYNEYEYLLMKTLRENSRFASIKNIFVQVPEVWDRKSESFGFGDKFVLNRLLYHEAVRILIKNI